MTRLKALVLFLVLGVGITTNLQNAEAAQTEVRYHWSLRTEWYLNKQAWRERVREERKERREAAQAAAAEVASVSASSVAEPSLPDGVVGCLSAAQVASLARAAGFPESVIGTMVAIAYRESHWCPGAVNASSGACGLWQMYPCPGDEALNPATNAAMAFAKYQASGLSPWGY